ncbi:MAG: hypothetical protein IJI25_03450 [Eubacterium sp.]|nr:hypothetical protein [Eubacterium sp.]
MRKIKEYNRITWLFHLGFLFLLCLSLLAGCGGSKSDKLDLPGKAVRFKTGSYQNPDKPGDKYEAISYKDRVYIPYGSANNDEMDDRVIDRCIGYISSGSGEDKDRRVYTLVEDRKMNYIMIYDVNEDLDQAAFYRCTDTRGRKIETPGYIDAVHYDYWE